MEIGNPSTVIKVISIAFKNKKMKSPNCVAGFLILTNFLLWKNLISVWYFRAVEQKALHMQVF